MNYHKIMADENIITFSELEITDGSTLQEDDELLVSKKQDGKAMRVTFAGLIFQEKEAREAVSSSLNALKQNLGGNNNEVKGVANGVASLDVLDGLEVNPYATAPSVLIKKALCVGKKGETGGSDITVNTIMYGTLQVGYAESGRYFATVLNGTLSVAQDATFGGKVQTSTLTTSAANVPLNVGGTGTGEGRNMNVNGMLKSSRFIVPSASSESREVGEIWFI